MLRRWTKTLIIFSALFALGFPATVFAEGIIEDKDTIENRGPGNLDVPMEGQATPSPSPSPKAKAPDQPKKKSSY